MRIAIIGAGFCGLAVAWHLSQKLPHAKIVLCDPKGIGGEASGIAVGLLHPFSGAHAKFNRMGREGMEATRELLDLASKTLNKPVATYDGIVRIAATPEQLSDYTLCLKKFPEDVSWMDTPTCQTYLPGVISSPALFIKNGTAVNCPLYLKGLWLACEKVGISLEIRKITTLSELEDFDIRIVATGAMTSSIPELAHLPIQKVKGQVLELVWPSELPSLKYPINSHAYILMSPSQKTCFVGATFEKGDFSIGPNMDVAKAELMPKVESILPCLGRAEIIGCQSGLRAVTPDYLPLVKEIEPQTWVITGMGSKGLLYHALMARHLVESILNSQKREY